jgi:hypothetical protein
VREILILHFIKNYKNPDCPFMLQVKIIGLGLCGFLKEKDRGVN